jgi:hypothetical protein
MKGFFDRPVFSLCFAVYGYSEYAMEFTVGQMGERARHPFTKGD